MKFAWWCANRKYNIYLTRVLWMFDWKHLYFSNKKIDQLVWYFWHNDFEVYLTIVYIKIKAWFISVGPPCPTCDENLNCQWNSVCDVSETCLIRSYANTAFTVHCSKVMLHSKHLTRSTAMIILMDPPGWGNGVCNLRFEF